MTEYERINITMPIGLAAKAKKLGLNISWEASHAVEMEIARKEKKE
jgi:post-segregation antitoxin (ccd killing protein)